MAHIFLTINKVYNVVLRVENRCNVAFFGRGQMAKIVYRATCWDCNDFDNGKTKRRLRNRKTEHFKALFNGHLRRLLWTMLHQLVTV